MRKELALGSWLAFKKTGDMTLVMGDLVLIESEVTPGEGRQLSPVTFLIASEVSPVIKALRDNGIAVTALHSHMLTENPRLFFMHFWANDNALKLAGGLRAALDRVNVVKKG